MYEIVLYKDKNGESEIENYLLELQKSRNKNSRIKFNKITAYINMLSKYGINIGTQYIKHINKEIWELRPIKDRILFAYWKDSTFVLLNIFMKKTQKTPKTEIEKARRLLKDFKDRSKYNE